MRGWGIGAMFVVALIGACSGKDDGGTGVSAATATTGVTSAEPPSTSTSAPTASPASTIAVAAPATTTTTTPASAPARVTATTRPAAPAPAPTAAPATTAPPARPVTTAPPARPVTTTTTTRPPSPSGAALTISGFRFSPDPLSIRAGTAVTVTNDDAATHTWTSDTGAWDSGALAKGGTSTVRFDTPGTFAYHCAIHPTMTGRVVVS